MVQLSWHWVSRACCFCPRLCAWGGRPGRGLPCLQRTEENTYMHTDTHGTALMDTCVGLGVAAGRCPFVCTC